MVKGTNSRHRRRPPILLTGDRRRRVVGGVSDTQTVAEPMGEAVPEQTSSGKDPEGVRKEEIAGDTLVQPPWHRLAIKTNLLYDAILMPSLEVEYRIDDRWSVAVEGSVAWWKRDRRHKYYQIATILPEGRYWFGTKKPWHGHYVGVFAGGSWYDLENGERGYKGEFFTTGVSYGYMFPIGRSLSIEAGLGVGFLYTTYEEYLPIDGHYVYQQTSRTNWFGPVKVKTGVGMETVGRQERRSAMKYKGIFLAVLLGGLTGLAGCRKDLCYDHDKHALTANVLLQPEWEKEWERDYGKGWSDNWPQEYGMEYDELRPEAATGIASFVYHQDGSRSERHHPAHGGELPMTAGEKSLLLHNDDTRYIVFDGLENSAQATASTRTRTRSTYSELHADEKTVNAPDMLYGAWIDSYTAVPTQDPTPLAVTMRPLTYTYLIRYEFAQGLEHVTLARGALSGMAQSVYLQNGSTGSQVATVLFECELKEYGVEVQALFVRSAGYPRRSLPPRQGGARQNLQRWR